MASSNVRWVLSAISICTALGAPPNRYGHAMVAGDDGMLWVFGGRSLLESEGSHPESGDLWRFDTEHRTWSLIRTSGAPSPRWGHAMVWLNSSVLVFGGRSASCILGDLWLLQREEPRPRWSRFAMGSGIVPLPRFASAVTWADSGDSFWLHGGAGAEGYEGLFSDLWLFRLSSGEVNWQRLDGSAGIRPPPRAAHTLTAGDGWLWLHGGFGDNRTLDDTWRFNLWEGLWRQLQPGPPRHGHVAFYFQGFCWLYGGSLSSRVPDMFRYDTVYDRWISVTASGQEPSSRSSLAGAFVDGRFWVHGGVAGSNGSDSLGDLWLWDAQAEEWTLESTYDTLALVNTRYLLGGLAVSCVSFLAVLLVTVMCFECSCLRMRELGCSTLFRPLAWTEGRQSSFAVCVALLMLAWSFLAVPGLIIFRWWADNEFSDSLDFYCLIGPAAYCMMSMVAISCFLLVIHSRSREPQVPLLEDPESLALFLVDADVKVVRPEFLRELNESKGLWPRRQEAEKLKTRSGRSALLSHAEIARWSRAMRKEPQDQRIICLSHMWESAEHPDPFGFQLSELVGLLQDAWGRDPRMVTGVFIDFMSLHLPGEQSKHDASWFPKALRSMQLLYAHDWTYTVCVAQLTPQSWKERRKGRPSFRGYVGQTNDAGYLCRGWCLTELQWAALRSSPKFGGLLGTASLKSQQVIRFAPRGPAAFRRALGKSSLSFRRDFFPLVAAQRSAFEERARTAQVWEVEELPESEMDILADSLQSFHILEQLRAHRCSISIQGFASRLPFLQSLRKVALRECAIADADMPGLAEALSSSCPWLSLDLSHNLIACGGACSLAGAMGRKPRLKELILEGNCIRDTGARTLLRAWVDLHNGGPSALQGSQHQHTDPELDASETAVLLRWRHDGILQMQRLDLQHNLITGKAVKELEAKRPRGMPVFLGRQKQIKEEPPEQRERASSAGSAVYEPLEAAHHVPEAPAPVHEAAVTGHLQDADAVQEADAVQSIESDVDADLRHIDLKLLMDEDPPPATLWQPSDEMRDKGEVVGPNCWAPFVPCAETGPCSLRL